MVNQIEDMSYVLAEDTQTITLQNVIVTTADFDKTDVPQTAFTIEGAEWPSTDKELTTVEVDYALEYFTIASVQPFNVFPSGTPGQEIKQHLLRDGVTYKLIKSGNWGAYNMYVGTYEEVKVNE